MIIEKLSLQSPDIVNENIEKIAALFPNCVTESTNGKAIDFEMLKQELSGSVVEGTKERYRLEWPGKREAIVTANLPTTKTLRPVRDDSVDFDNTENLYIEGDNLEVLKLLQESYLGKIKMIYIDPPYNTGKDFIYQDNFNKSRQDELFESGQKDEINNRLILNFESSGRYHSDWLTLIYPRLKLARNLMCKDGVIFISIDDHEVHNLKKMLDEIFGEQNFIADISVVNNLKGRNDKKYIATANERLLMYVKSEEFEEYGLALPEDKLSSYTEGENENKFRLIELRKRGGSDTRAERPNMYYPIFINPKTGDASLIQDETFSIMALPKKSNGVDGRWRWGMDTARIRIKSLVGYAVRGSEKYNVYEKDFLEQDGELRRIKPKSVMAGAAYSTDTATKKYKALMGEVEFTNPKPIDFLNDLIRYVAPPNSGAIILDFFSGSATTANSVLDCNAKDGGNRNYILIQLPELVSADSYSHKNGFHNICEIGKERIRRAAKKIKEETNADIDYGFRVYRLDESNMQDVYHHPQDLTQGNLDLFADNVKPDRSAGDLLAQVMLAWGLPLSLKIGELLIEGKKVFTVAENSMYACFEKGIDEAFAKALARDRPLRVVFRDNGFKNDTAKTNVKQLLKQLSPETEMKVI